jgi:GAF domain-containing protein
MDAPLPHDAPDDARRARYAEVRARVEALIEDEDDLVAALSTVVCELHHSFAAFDWTGFYRVVAPETLAVGPYMGGHGCLRIHFSRGVCGAAARTRQTQRVPDVHAFPDHIACSGSTRSEIVLPLIDRKGDLLAVLDVDSDQPDAFSLVDQAELEALLADLGQRFPALRGAEADHA